MSRLARAANQAVSDTEVRKRLVTVGLQPLAMDPAQFATHIQDQYALYGKVIDEAGIKP